MKVTIFQNFTQIISHQHISEVLNEIKSGKYKSQVAELQKLVNSGKEEEYNKQKKSLPAFTPCGTFVGGRKPEFFKEYSGLVILDFDKLTDSHLKLISEKVPAIPYTLALFKSPSGNGYKILVRVTSPPPSEGGGREEGSDPAVSFLKNLQQFHLTAFNLVRQYYENTLALHVDPSGKDITRLCFFSYAPDLYYNPEATVFPIRSLSEVETTGTNQNKLTDDIENIISQIESHRIDITSTYDDWIKICFALIDAMGAHARYYFHRVSRFNPEYTVTKCNTQFDHCLNNKNSGITIKTFFGFARDHGIIISRKQKKKCQAVPACPNINTSDGRVEAQPKKNTLKSPDSKLQTPDSITGKQHKIKTNKFHLVRDYLTDNFDIRYNCISTEFEYKEKDQTEYKAMNENNIFIKMCLDGLTFSLNNLMAFLKSDIVPRYNAFTRYFESLPPWSGDTDHIQNLASYVKLKSDVRGRFDNHFKKWLVRVVKCAIVDSYFNKQAFILVHEKQNSGKSTFCRFICPPALANYIAENLSIDKDSRILLTTNLLINLDELSTLSKFEISSLKSLFSKDKINDRLPYDRRNSIIPRRASFIGSTNQAEFLNDESGSVRWLCFQIESIDWSYKEKINIDDVWAQAYSLYKTNFPCDLSQDEIKENEEYNRQFHITTSEFELVQKYFSPATKEAHECFMTATDIVMYLSENTFGRVKLSPINVGKALKMLSFAREKKYPEKIYGYYITKKII